MKTDIIKQEIILVIPTIKIEFCEKGQAKPFPRQQGEQLEEACWNGLLDELLVGIIETPARGKRLCIWQIRQGKSFLEIELCKYPQTIDKNLSLNPYTFLPTLFQN